MFALPAALYCATIPILSRLITARPEGAGLSLGFAFGHRALGGDEKVYIAGVDEIAGGERAAQVDTDEVVAEGGLDAGNDSGEDFIHGRRVNCLCCSHGVVIFFEPRSSSILG